MTVELYLGDCLKYMRTMPAGSVDAVITDPPYLEGDFSYLLPEFLRISERTILTPGKLESFNWIARQKPVWEYCWKNSTISLGGSACLHIGFEPILAYQFPIKPLGNDVLDIPAGNEKGTDGHPWPKPIKLYSKLITHWSKIGDTIFDPFMGSGTTGVACVQLGRNFIGCEIDPKYFEIAKKRIEQAELQPQLFTEKKPEEKQGDLI